VLEALQVNFPTADFEIKIVLPISLSSRLLSRPVGIGLG
jgi:hypothetical protein